MFLAAALQGVSAQEGESGTYTLEQLRKRPAECDKTILETYLSESEFKKSFGMTKTEFTKLPLWKKTDLKKKLQLH
jgi:hypothetical protein